MARITGRLVRPSTLAERRVFKMLGTDFIRCPRSSNPYALARLIRRLSLGGSDMPKLQRMLRTRTAPTEPVLPDSTSAPKEERAA